MQRIHRTEGEAVLYGAHERATMGMQAASGINTSIEVTKTMKNRLSTITTCQVLALSAALSLASPAGAQIDISVGQTTRIPASSAHVVCEGGITFSAVPLTLSGDQTTGTGFVQYLPPHVYFMTLEQSGDFDLVNPVIGWNGLHIGTFQLIDTGTSTITISGIVPSNTSVGDTNRLTLKVRNTSGHVVACGTRITQVGAVSGGWELEWSRSQSNDSLGDPIHHIGDFDGDGAEEIFSISGSHGTGDWMTVYSYDGGQWQWGWSNYGNPSAGNGIYPYRASMVVGDFDGDGKDEIMGNPDGGWLTMFEFEGGDWQWAWSNYGSPSAGNGIVPYGSNLVAGDYDGDGRDELLGAPLGGWITMFHYQSGDWQWGWSNYGNQNLGISPYHHLVAVDLDGDGNDEVLGLDSWATTFDFDGVDFNWLWSTYGSSNLGGWGYPFANGDRLLVGDIDGNDLRDELFFIQTGVTAGWATTMDFAGGVPNWNWSNYGSPPSIGNWPVASANDTRYSLVRAVAGEPEFLISRRRSGSYWNVHMYRSDSNLNY